MTAPRRPRRSSRSGQLSGLLLLTLVSVILAACGSAPAAESPTSAPAAPAPTSAPAAPAPTSAPAPTAEPAGPVVATIGLGELVTSLDPPTDWAIVATWIHMNMFDCLVWRNRDTAEFEGWLAESYENVDDTTWRFNLRKGVTFHNGEEFNADAVAWTYERILADDKMITYPQWTFIDKINIIDPYTVDIVTKAPEPAMLSKISGTGCGIQAPVAGKAAKAAGSEFAPIGTGPYMFSEFVKDDYIKLVSNTEYWQGAPQIEELIFRAIPETSTRVASLISGDIDLMVGVPTQDWERVNANEGTNVEEYLTNRTLLIALRTAGSGGVPEWTGVTSDKRIRQAISYAIDRASLVELVDGMGIPTLSRITPPTLGWSDKFFNQLGEYNPDKARELLAEAGYNGEPLTFHTSTAFLYQKEVAEAVTAMLQDVGLNIDLQVMDTTTFREQVYFPNKNDEIYMDALGNSFFDPWITVREFSVGQKQRTGWVNAEAEQLIDAGAVNMDPTARAAQYLRIQELITEDVPHVYLYLMKDAMGKSDKLDFAMNPDNFLWMGNAVMNP